MSSPLPHPLPLLLLLLLIPIQSHSVVSIWAMDFVSGDCT